MTFSEGVIVLWSLVSALLKESSKPNWGSGYFFKKKPNYLQMANTASSPTKKYARFLIGKWLSKVFSIYIIFTKGSSPLKGE